MHAARLEPKRFQLKKEAVQVANTGHPWIFRSHLSSATETFRDGQWLRLFDAANGVVGYGIYDASSLIGVRMLKLGKNIPDREWIIKTIEKALAKRDNLKTFTDAYRALHGENDGLPGVVMDVYGDTGVLQTYAPSVDVLGRYAAAYLRKRLNLKRLVWKLPTKRRVTGPESEYRILFGPPAGVVKFNEGKLLLAVNVAEGQKSGTFLDLRGLRKYLTMQKLAGKRVLNLFSYTGTLGLAAEAGGASDIWNVDISEGALEFAKKHHAREKSRHTYLTKNVFEWINELPAAEKFDVIIVDPPQMASRTIQVPNALKAYDKLVKAAVPHLKPQGQLIVACCTSRIPRKRFQEAIDRSLGSRLRLKTTLMPEDDHPAGFAEGDYLKILVYR